MSERGSDADASRDSSRRALRARSMSRQMRATEEVFMSQPEKKGTQEFAKSTAVINKKSKGFTALVKKAVS
jgi:hypothetical protein